MDFLNFRTQIFFNFIKQSCFILNIVKIISHIFSKTEEQLIKVGFLEDKY